MNWYYAAGGQQQGPVDDAQLDALIAAGTVRADTLVWREGLANWQPLRDARPGAGGAPPMAVPPVGGAAAPAPGADQVRCVECGNLFTRDNAIQYGTVWVCAGCKPRFIQKLREGAPAGGAISGQTGVYVEPAVLVEQALARGPRVDIGGCLGRAWDLMKSNFWVLVGATAVNTICQSAVSNIPFLGICLGPVLQGPLMGGLYLLFLKSARREESGFGDAFSGFSNFLPLMLASIVTTVLILVSFTPAGVCLLISGQRNDDMMAIAAVVLALLALPIVIYLAIAWMFTYLLIMDKKYDFWTAMNVSRKVLNKCWWSMFLLFILLCLIQILGFLALCVGIFVTMSLLYGAVVYAYEDIFRGGSTELA